MTKEEASAIGSGHRGSVTELLLSSLELYRPPSPSHHPPPEPDCWEESRRVLRPEKDKLVTNTRLTNPGSPSQRRTEHSDETPSSRRDKVAGHVDHLTKPSPRKATEEARKDKAKLRVDVDKTIAERRRSSGTVNMMQLLGNQSPIVQKTQRPTRRQASKCQGIRKS